MQNFPEYGENTILDTDSYEENPILDTDSYKASHAAMYAPNTRGMFSYFESRGGEFPETVFFGLQMIVRKYLKPFTQKNIDDAEIFLKAHGEPFNKEAFQYILKEYGGHWPVRIRAVPEGSVVPTHNVLMTVECLDPKCFWVTNWLETLLVRVWYPITVATQSYHLRKVIYQYLQETADDPDAEIDFKLHDFGSRGVTCREQAGLGGAAHLAIFKGSDTMEGIRYANFYYDSPMAGFSIPAAEHSTVMSFEQEDGFYANFVQEYLYKQKFALAACVSDTTNLWRVIDEVWCGSQLEAVKNSGGCLVVRPDSGVPVVTVIEALKRFNAKLNMQKNSKGYKVLPPYYRMIQGDGIDRHTIPEILEHMKLLGYSASNLAFGSGGGLLQKLNRDTCKCAFKVSAFLKDYDGEREWFNVSKNPITDSGKRSKAGRLDLVPSTFGANSYATAEIPYGFGVHPNSVMVGIYDKGYQPSRVNLETVRNRIKAHAKEGLSDV
jgi:nicotinamide phosphoribosyltransferase